MEWLWDFLKIGEAEEWYEIEERKWYEYPQTRLILDNYYHGFMGFALRSIFPQASFCEWLFPGKIPSLFWESEENVSRYFQWLALKLEIHSWEVRQLKGGGLLKKCGGMAEMIKRYSKREFVPLHGGNNFKFKLLNIFPS
jgi:hypothetical protein